MDANLLIRNVALLTRQALLQRLLNSDRDIDQECGYPTTITTEDYQKAFTRNDVAARVVTIFPDETWNQNPVIFETEDDTETEFERVWKENNKRLHFIPYLQRADVLSGIGRYGILLLGIDDGLDLSLPVEGIDDKGEKVGEGTERNLLFLRPLEETYVSIKALENDTRNPRYGLPLSYEVRFVDSILGETVTASKVVHWTRVIHLCDNRTNSEVFGLPRLQKVYDRLLDTKKVAGGSGEMFWKGGFPGLSIESQPSLGEEVEFDKEATKEQIEAYMNGLQRYLATIGMTVKSLTPQVADPTAHVETHLRLISCALGVPWRIFLGSEAAQLASEQDVQTWNRRISRRRETYVNPFIIRPFVDRLIAFGVLPEPEEYDIAWPDLNAPGEEEKASIAEKRTNSLAKYATSGADLVIPPFHYLTLVLGMTDEEAEAIIEEAGDRLQEFREEQAMGEEEDVEEEEGASNRNGER